jgi:hypothetical protein
MVSRIICSGSRDMPHEAAWMFQPKVDPARRAARCRDLAAGAVTAEAREVLLELATRFQRAASETKPPAHRRRLLEDF